MSPPLTRHAFDDGFFERLAGFVQWSKEKGLFHFGEHRRGVLPPLVSAANGR